MGSSQDVRIDEARTLYEKSPSEVKDLADSFFKSMDTNGNGSVDFQEIQSFLRSGNFHVGPYQERALFDELDRNHDNILDFEEFITFFYIVFIRARCNRCDKWLMGKKRRTCVDCFMLAKHNTYDLCWKCFHFHGIKHDHPRSQFMDYEELVFEGNEAKGMEPRHKQFRRLYIAIQIAANGAAILAFGTALICTIM